MLVRERHFLPWLEEASSSESRSNLTLFFYFFVVLLCVKPLLLFCIFLFDKSSNAFSDALFSEDDFLVKKIDFLVFSFIPFNSPKLSPMLFSDFNEKQSLLSVLWR